MISGKDPKNTEEAFHLWDPEEAERCPHDFVKSNLVCTEKETGLKRPMQCCRRCGFLVKVIPNDELSEHDELV